MEPNFVCVLFQHTRKKKIVPLRWCFGITNSSGNRYNKLFPVFFSKNKYREPAIEQAKPAYILNFYSK